MSFYDNYITLTIDLDKITSIQQIRDYFQRLDNEVKKKVFDDINSLELGDDLPIVKERLFKILGYKKKLLNLHLVLVLLYLNVTKYQKEVKYLVLVLLYVNKYNQNKIQVLLISRQVMFILNRVLLSLMYMIQCLTINLFIMTLH
jgi:hypothetical protein